jgi:glycosyltransferase involved in cell wall biosynthesis
LYGNWYADNYEKWIKNNSDMLDFVYMNRPHISIKYIDLIKKHTKAKTIYYGHDLHYIRELKRYQLEGNSELIASSDYWKKIEFELFGKSDIILTLSESEKEIIQKNFPNKPIFTFPVFYYDEVLNNPLDFEERKDLLFVGGFSHAPNVDAVLWFTKEVFPNIVEIYPDIKLHIVGSNPAPEISKLNGPNIIVKGFVDDNELKGLYNKCRLVVIPLRYGAGVKGKTIEAMYHQIPIVSTEFGIEGLPNITTKILITNTAEEFADRVNILYSNINELNEIGESFQEYIKMYYTKESAFNVFNSIFGGTE